MKKKQLKLSEDGKCPYCLSDYVVKTSVFENSETSEKPHQNKKITYKCYICNKVFYCNAGI